MRKDPVRQEPDADEDTMRPEYDFSDGVRGVTAARFAQGSNVVVGGLALRDCLSETGS